MAHKTRCTEYALRQPLFSIGNAILDLPDDVCLVLRAFRKARHDVGVWRPVRGMFHRSIDPLRFALTIMDVRVPGIGGAPFIQVVC